MQNKTIALALLAFLSAAPAARADAPATLSDAQLASYISGQLTTVLATSGYDVTESCDDRGCSVVVQ